MIEKKVTTHLSEGRPMLTVSNEALLELQRRYLSHGLRIKITGDKCDDVIVSVKIDEQNPNDRTSWFGGIVKILLDPDNVAMLANHELHYLDEPHRKFILRNR
ncbi:MAG: hypothetical protein PHY28_10070 [Dehalococcoidales bacterium]|nr:hypothetical protein [Dehalococcoidales bacterium]